MKIGEKKLGKKEMKNIRSGLEKNTGGQSRGAPAKNPRSKCAFVAGSCCQRTDCCPTETNG